MVTTDNATSHGQLSIITKGIKQHHNVAGIVHLAHHGSSGGINIHPKPMTTDGAEMGAATIEVRNLVAKLLRATMCTTKATLEKIIL